jgi:hypothetical protein
MYVTADTKHQTRSNVGGYVNQGGLQDCPVQDDQIGLILAFWLTIFLASFLKITEVAQS